MSTGEQTMADAYQQVEQAAQGVSKHDALKHIASGTQSKANKTEPKKSWWMVPAVVAGGLIVVFGIIPAMRGTDALRAWKESKAV